MYVGTIKATGDRRLKIKIGDGGGKNTDGEATTVTNTDGDTVTARGGSRGSQSGHGNGGRGWSGGGGKAAAGGCDGGDGEVGLHVHPGGDGQHVSLPTVDGLSIEPGKGGKSCLGCIWGGGGGGIIVNGQGWRAESGASQGYGAGGGQYGGSKGQSGLVILYA